MSAIAPPPAPYGTDDLAGDEGIASDTHRVSKDNRVAAGAGTLVLSALLPATECPQTGIDAVCTLGSDPEDALQPKHSRQSLLAAAPPFLDLACDLVRLEKERACLFFDDPRRRGLAEQAGSVELPTHLCPGWSPPASILPCRKS